MHNTILGAGNAILSKRSLMPYIIDFVRVQWEGQINLKLQPDQCYEREVHGAMRANHREANQVRIGFQEELRLDCCLKDENGLTVCRVWRQEGKAVQKGLR